MSLNSTNKELYNYLREIPLDKDSLPEQPLMPYQTKVQIYDSKCSDCGFAKILIEEKNTANQSVIVREFYNIQDAINYASIHRCMLIRTCTYPFNLTYIHDKPVYPTITDIVTNTCQFWNIDKMNIPTDTEFIEIDLEEFVGQKRNIKGERISEKSCI